MIPTDVYNIMIIITNTNLISYTTTYTNATYYNDGFVYINPSSFFVLPTFDPLRVFSSLIIFLLVGLAMKKSINAILIWLGLLFTGTLNTIGIYWQFAILIMISSYVIFKFVHGVKK